MDIDEPGSHRDHAGGCTIDACIPASAFPSTRDQLLVALVRHHAKSSLLWGLSRLPERRTFANATEVEEAVGAAARASTPLEPW